LGVFWTLENPLSSKLWAWPPLAKYLRTHTHRSAEVHMCMYGATYLKPTRLCGSLPRLDELERLCCGGHLHERLQGTVKVPCPTDPAKLKAIWKTKLAGVYPAPLCRAWAALAADAARHAGREARALPVDVGLTQRLAADLREWEALLCRVRRQGAPSGFVPACPPGAPPEWPPDAPQ